MKRKISFVFRGKRFQFSARVCSIFSSGLMFRSRRAQNCLFEFRKKRRFKITSLFVFFPFIAVWLDSGNRVAEAKVVRPFTFEIYPKKPFMKLLEVPIFSGDSLKLLSLVEGERFK